MVDPAGYARLPVRTAGFSALTFTLLGLLDLDTRRARPEERPRVLAKWMRRYGRSLLALYGLEVSARGPHLERGGFYPGKSASGRGRVFVMNHRSTFDVFATLAFVEATILSRGDLASWPVIGLAARKTGVLFVDRESRASGAAVISAMVKSLEGGRGVMVYPEGTTFSGDEVMPFKPGAFAAAARAGAEVVPLGIAYEGEAASFSNESFPRHYARLAMTRRTRVALVAGEPLSPPTDIEAARAAAREAVQTLVNRARAELVLPR